MPSLREPLAFAFLGLLALTFTVYAPGLSGGFLFDDFINLDRLGELGGVDDWSTAVEYLLGGNSAAAGRPVSLASFLLDANDWPADPGPFKYTNLLLHLLITTLVTTFALQLSRALGYSARRQQVIAVLAAAIWALHPFFVSTVLYIVQRMAMLSTLFIFAGLALYVLGRRRLAAGRLREGYLLVSLAIGLFTPLAFLSKQNGALLPLLAIVLEHTVLRGLQPDDARRWRFRAWSGVFLYLPIGLIAGYFVATWEQTIVYGYVREGMTLHGRLLTQPRILFDYLGHLVFPRIQTSGLFHDDIEMSKSLIEPPITFLAATGIVLAAVLAVVYRRRFPVISAAALFYLAGHLIESSFVPLELYFEHRNYMPTLLMAFGIAAAVSRMQPRQGTALSLLLVSVLATFTALRANLWSDSQVLVLTWAQEAPESLRGHQYSALVYFNEGRPDLARRSLEQGLELAPEHGVLRLQHLVSLCATGRFSEAEFERTKRTLKDDPISNYVIRNLEVLVARAVHRDCGSFDARAALDFVDSLLSRQKTLLPGTREDLGFMKGRILLELGRGEDAATAFRAAAAANRSLPATIRMAAELASAGYHAEALDFLDLADQYRQRRSTRPGLLGIRDAARQIAIDYEAEIDRLRRTIRRETQRRTGDG